jgi:hypothetical protein
MRRRRLIELLVVRWWFAVMIAIAIAVGFVAAMTVAPPSDIPNVALRAMPVYRVEVGAAVFFGLYLATMAFALALHNRAFTEMGTRGIRAQDLAAEEQFVYFEELVMEVMDEARHPQPWREERENVRRETT